MTGMPGFDKSWGRRRRGGEPADGEFGQIAEVGEGYFGGAPPEVPVPACACEPCREEVIQALLAFIEDQIPHPFGFSQGRLCPSKERRDEDGAPWLRHEREVHLNLGLNFDRSIVQQEGLYSHCFTASIAAGASKGCPLIS